MLLENEESEAEKPMRVCQTIQQRQTSLCDTAVLPMSEIIVIVNKTKKTTKGSNMEDSRGVEKNYILSVVQTLN